jgi:caffeoyl-CoA O-methyltransferase
MFHDLPEAMRSRMSYLESVDASQRRDANLPRRQRLLQISPETGRFLAIMAASAPSGCCLEIGTSAGYSTLWLALACRAGGKTIKTFEVQDEKARFARESFRAAQVESLVELAVGDARQYVPGVKGVAFCFLDADKADYQEFYELVIPNMVDGGILIADNIISHQALVEAFVERAMTDPRVDALVVPIGKGLLVCKKTHPS